MQTRGRRQRRRRAGAAKQVRAVSGRGPCRDRGRMCGWRLSFGPGRLHAGLRKWRRRSTVELTRSVPIPGAPLWESAWSRRTLACSAHGSGRTSSSSRRRRSALAKRFWSGRLQESRLLLLPHASPMLVELVPAALLLSSIKVLVFLSVSSAQKQPPRREASPARTLQLDTRTPCGHAQSLQCELKRLPPAKPSMRCWSLLVPKRSLVRSGRRLG